MREGGAARLPYGWLLWAAAAVVLLSSVATLVYFLSDRSRAPAGIGAGGRPAIAVMAFQNPANAEDVRWLTTGLPALLETGLAQTPGLDVVSSERISEVLSDTGQSSVAALDRSRVLDVARRAGAGALVNGAVFKAGDEVRVDVQVQEAATGRVVGAYTARGDNLFALADDLTARIRNGLNISSTSEARAVAEITTTSAEAFRLFTEAQEAMANVRHADARRLLEEAVRLDPQFAEAYASLMVATRNLGDAAASAAYEKKIEQYIDRLPERRRLLFEADQAR